ncbi:hypothetical protein FRC10_011919 [Ceratobasidium sp. 414]|nr:hypothetical protein FRC10_011919 [Ceratobasidium sp. 414]
MLRTTILRSGLYPRLALPHLAQASSFACRRSLSTSLQRQKPEANKFVTKEGRSTGGSKGIPTEGLHYKGMLPAVLTMSWGQKRLAPTITRQTKLHKPRQATGCSFIQYTDAELKSVTVFHRTPENMGDKIAFGLVKLCRWGFDLFSGYKYKPIPPGSNMSLAELRKGGYIMTESEWLMKRDAGWIHTLLEEAENERMHLMTFMTLKKPSIWFRAMILGAQGVFYNAFFFGYLISPRSAHRFVGFLEEEAVSTYTRCIAEMEAGRIPEWENKPAPSIAIDYWRLPEDATLLDVIKAVRADESTHRFVNHSLANLKQTEDLNPFAIREPEMRIKGSKPGFSREESEAFVNESRQLLDQVKHKAS